MATPGVPILNTPPAATDNFFAQGGNSFGATAVLGTNDTFGLEFETDGVTRQAIDANGNFTLTQGIQTSGSPNFFTAIAAAHTTLAAGAEAIDIDLNLARTVQFSTGAIATQRAMVVRAPTYAFVAASTITQAATFAITGAPIAGPFATLTNSFALWVQSGQSQFDGNVTIDGKLTVTGAIDPLSVLLSDPAAGTALFFESNDGQTAPVSGAATGRLRYNDATAAWQVSVQTGVYADLATTANAFVDGGNSFGANATLGTNDAFDLIIETNGVELSRFINGVGYAQGAISFADGNTVFQIDTNAAALRNFRFRNLSSSGSATADIIVSHGTSSLFLRAALNGTSVLQVTGGSGMVVGDIVDSSSFVNIKAGSGGSPNQLIVRASGLASLGINPPAIGTTRVLAMGTNIAAGAFCEISNQANTTTTRVGYVINSIGGNAELLVNAPNFTPLGGREANQFVLESDPSLSAGINILTAGTTPIKFKTNTVERGLIDANGNWTFTQGVQTSGSPTFITMAAAAHTTLAAGVEAITVDFDLSATVQFATGAIATQRAVLVQEPTYAFVAASTITIAATLAIVDAPQAGANATLTESLALFIQAGGIRIGGQFVLDDDTPATLVGDQNDLALGDDTVQRLATSTGGGITITGFVAPPNRRVVIITNIGANTLRITNDDAASAAANRVLTGTGTIMLGTDDSVILWYDITTARWRAIS